MVKLVIPKPLSRLCFIRRKRGTLNPAG